MRWMDNIKSVTGFSVNDWHTLVYNIEKMLNPKRRQWKTTPLRMLLSTSPRTTRSLKLLRYHDHHHHYHAYVFNHFAFPGMEYVFFCSQS